MIRRHVSLNGCLRLAAGLVLLCAVVGCAPKLDSLEQNYGPEHTLVKVHGEHLFGTQVVWDAGSADETVLPGGFLGGYMFTVPPGASTGQHEVALRNPWGTTATVNFKVTPPQVFPGPRVDHVSLVFAEFGGGQVNPVLYVQGANIDVGAVVRLQAGGSPEPVDVATVAHRGMWMERYKVSPEHLGFPIYHYVSLIALPGSFPVGDELTLSVVNLDNVASEPFAFSLPESEETLDMDGDGLLNAWEEGGFVVTDAGTVDFDLDAVGCHPLRRDILVEVDAMEGLEMPEDVQDAARDMFAAAPVLNPVGANGINLYLDTSGSCDFNDEVTFEGVYVNPGDLPCSDPDHVPCIDFADIKADHFDNASRGGVFHYAVWAKSFPPYGTATLSGLSDADFENPDETMRCGDDLVVAVAMFGGMTTRTLTEVFVHELGHNLGQTHGGGFESIAEIYKPNYWSVMSYTWQFRPIGSDFDRRMNPTCAPFYWADSAAFEEEGVAPSNQNAVIDYSHGMGRVLDETDLVGVVGVCGVPVDWAWVNEYKVNDADDPTDYGLVWAPSNLPVTADINHDGDTNDKLEDFNNWAAIKYCGPKHGGKNTS